MSNNYSECVRDLLACAIQIAQDDPELHAADYNAFERVMWVDDSGLSYWDLNREEYADAMREAWLEFGKQTQPRAKRQ